MVGIIIVTHFGLGEKFVEAATEIAGRKPENVVAITTNHNKDVHAINQDIAKALKDVDGEDGVLILTDMFGGTPCNMSLPFLKEGKVEVLTGLNLPMLVEVIDGRKNHTSVGEFAQYLQTLGQKNICLASEILNKKPNDG